jgi:hypothetical protein
MKGKIIYMLVNPYDTSDITVRESCYTGEREYFHPENSCEEGVYVEYKKYVLIELEE